MILFLSSLKNYRPLLLEDLHIFLPGLKFRRLRLNRHLPDVERVAEHCHRFGQVLLYLGGRGIVRSGRKTWAIVPGAVLWVPPGVRHGFDEQSGRRPLCLVLEFHWQGQAPRQLTLEHLPGGEMAQVRRLLSSLSRRAGADAGQNLLGNAVAILGILDLVFPALGLLPRRLPPVSPLQRRVERVLRAPGGVELSVSDIAGHIGLGPEHLSRSLREHTGQTLRQLRDRERLAIASRLLQQGASVADAGAAAGILDQNYFARWFKKQTGASPSLWARRERSGSVKPPF